MRRGAVDGADLDGAIERIAAELAPKLVAEIRDGAVGEVRSELSRRLTDALLRKCGEEMVAAAGEEPVPRAPAPATEERQAAPAEPHAAGEPHPLAEHARREAVGQYVYGVVRAGSELPDGLIGVEPTARVRQVEARGLAALVSEVPLAEFDETSLRDNLNDVAWLEEKARAHEHVLEAALTEAAVVPLRLCTVFAGEPQVREMLSREHGVLVDALERLDGKAEWGVKAFADRGAIEREALRRAEETEDEDEVSAGTAYMNRRRREARAREEVEEIADGWAREIHAELAADAGEALLNPLQRPEVSGHPGEMLLNGVYLVADEEAAGFRSTARVLAERFETRGVEVVLTGPWPAYNFVKSSIEAAR